ncbi:MAG: DUF5813 family protein [Halobacteriaceae archaeon]
MSDGDGSPAVAGEDAYETHGAFEATGGGAYAVTEATFEARVVPAADGADRLIATMPTLDDAVEGETVAAVIEDGWYETLTRRLADAPTVATGPVSDPEVERDGGAITLTCEIGGETRAADALAVVHYAEGRWFEGVVPGYDYVETVAAVREQARDRASGQGGEEGGGPPL